MGKRKSSQVSLENSLSLCRSAIKKKLLLPEKSIRGYEKERTHLLDTLRRTLEMGESNSLLIIGPRGCGKTALLGSVLNELRNEGAFDSQGVLVQLNGLMHTDDRLALKDATRQLHLENAVGNRSFGSFAENLSFLLQCLQSGSKSESKAVVFVLEEFDLFCGHHNQTLLYNLFDVAQSAQAPLCVVGVTCRLDVTELLEKRVKSRFSHRQVFLFPRTESHLQRTLQLLSLNSDDADAVLVHCWNSEVQTLCAEDSVREALTRLHQLDASERALRFFLLMLVSRLSPTHTCLTTEDFTQVLSHWTRDAKVAMLEGLSVLELCLVIAMKHHTEIYEGEPLNFEMVYRRYLKFASQNATVHSVERPVVLKAFEHLKSLELVAPLTGMNNHVLKEFQLHRFLLTSDQVGCAVRQYQGLPTEVAQWAASSYQ